MTENYLLIDHGNTRLKWIRAIDGKLREDTAGRGDFDAFAEANKDKDSPSSVLLSSVAGNVAGHAGESVLNRLHTFCKTQWNIDPDQLHSAEQGSQVANGYKNPETLGIDRWLAVCGAVSRYGKPVVVWDLGTATTIDAVDENGLYVGGMIYPGPGTMLDSLGNKASLRAPGDFSGARLKPGRTTAECIGNGVLAAQVGALNQFMHHASESIGANPKLVVTGGFAADIIPLLDFPCVLDPWLVFRGMLSEGFR